MVEPMNVAADPSLVESLAANLKEIRQSTDAGTIKDSPETFGLAPPTAIVRVYGADPKTPLAGLEIGRTVREQLYVKPEGSPAIEVIDPRRMNVVRSSAADWRDKALFDLPSFRVGTLSVTGPGRELKAVREQPHWQLLRPFRAVAEDEKVEGAVAELTSLRVAKGNAGFVANDVLPADAAKYGLEPPAMKIELQPLDRAWKPQTLYLGNAKPAQETRPTTETDTEAKPEAKLELYYARAGDQDDVVLIDAKEIRDLGRDPNALRSKKVVELNPAAVEFVSNQRFFGGRYDLARRTKGWEQVHPTREPAESGGRSEAASRVAEAQTSEFLAPENVSRPGLDPAAMTLSVWQAEGRSKLLALRLAFAPQDRAPRGPADRQVRRPLTKLIFALEGDRSILAIPEKFAKALPATPLAFHDRTILTLSPVNIRRLAIHREGTTYEVAAPNQSGKTNRWQMIAPVKAAADDAAVTHAAMLLGNLRRELRDRPLGRRQVLRFRPARADRDLDDRQRAEPHESQGRPEGARVERNAADRQEGAQVGFAVRQRRGSSAVFTLPAEAVAVFEAELHTRHVLAFAAESARRLILHWPERSFSFKREGRAGKGVSLGSEPRARRRRASTRPGSTPWFPPWPT